MARLGCKANGASTNISQYACVKLGASNTVSLPSAANDDVTGIIQEKITQDGVSCSVAAIGERTRALAYAAISAGDRVCAADTSGRIKTAAATLTTALAGANNDLVFTAIGAFQGAIGDAITIEYIDPSAASQSLAVTVHGLRIRVSLATDTSGTITSTAALIAAAIAAHATAGLMVSAANSGSDDGSGVVIAMSEAGLTGGAGDFATAEQAATAQDDQIFILVGGK
jgi:hypothetical protein